MKGRLLFLVAIVAMGNACGGAGERLQVYGNVRGPGQDTGWYEVWTFFQRTGDAGLAGVASSDRDGNWGHHAPEGVYTFAVLDAFGRGPFIRPGVILSNDRFNRVDMAMHFAYDIGGREPSGLHREIGQTFVATGRDIIVVDTHGLPADTILTLRRSGPDGEEVASVPHRSRFVSGDLPTDPGAVHYIGWTKADGSRVEMPRTSRGNPYPHGTAYYDGAAQADTDLGMQISVMPAGQLLTNFKRGGELYRWADAGYSQTFTACGTSLACIDFDVAYGDKPWTDPTVRVLRGGPAGSQVGPLRRSRPCIYAPGEVPLEPGAMYCIEITEPGDPPGFNTWVEAGGDVVEGGHLFVNGRPEPDRDLCFALAEYVADETPPPAVTNIRTIPGDGMVKLVFEAPETMDISNVVIRRSVGEPVETLAEGIAVADVPVSAKGIYWTTDRGLEPHRTYLWSFFSVDAAGNATRAVAAGQTAPGMILPAEVINGDFTAGWNGLAPYGWGVVSLQAWPHFTQTDSSAGAGNGAGWSTFMAAHDILFYQQVPVIPGRRYLLEAHTLRREPWNNGNANELTAVGLDPAGGLDPLAPTVVWSDSVYAAGVWKAQCAAATAAAEAMTVFLRGRAQYAGGNMTCAFSNVELTDTTVSGK